MADLFGLKILLLWAGIIGLASCQSAPDSGSTTNSVSATLPPLTATDAALPSGTSLTVSTLPPRTMTATTVMPTDTSATARTPPVTSPTLTSISPSAELNSTTTSASAAFPASTPPSNTTKPTDPQANTTQSQTSRPLTTSNSTVTPTTRATTKAPPQCSYNVTTIVSGFRIDMMTSSTPGNYIINFTEKGRNEPTVHSFNGTSHEIKHLRPCTEYELSVAYRDDAGNETLCTSTQSKMKTTRMSETDIKEGSCMPGYVCYQSDWDISSSLSTSNNISAVPCKSSNTELCIKPNYNDICTNLTTTFTSGDCANTFSRTKSITVEPEDIPHVDWTNPEHNVVRVSCTYGKRFNGPEKEFTARLYYNGALQEEKTSVKHCNFEFKDLSYLTEYEVEVFAFNGHNYSNPKIITVTTSYSIKALIARLVVFIIASVALVVVVYKIYIPWHKKSRNDANDDMVLESTEDYVNVPQHEHHC